RSSVDDMAADAARLAWDVGHLAPVDHVVLGDAPLPAFRENRAWIDASGRQTGVSSGGDTVTGKAGWVREWVSITTICLAAVHGARHTQTAGKGEPLLRVQYRLIGTRVAVSVRCGTVHLCSRVVA